MENVKEWMQLNSEKKYSEFNRKFINTARKMYGVRMPKLRAYAKQLVKQYDLDCLEFIDDESYEEVLLQGLVIAYSKELIELKEQFLYDYLCKCDNWALVDSVASTFKLKGIEKQILYDIIKSWRNDEHEYVIRYVLVQSLNAYLDDEHIDDILAYSKAINADTYQAKMANGWLLATAYIDYPEMVREVGKSLDNETFRMTKGKIRDSYRVSKEEKEKFVR